MIGEERECESGQECKYGKGNVLELVILEPHPRRECVQSDLMKRTCDSRRKKPDHLGETSIK